MYTHCSGGTLKAFIVRSNVVRYASTSSVSVSLVNFTSRSTVTVPFAGVPVFACSCTIFMRASICSCMNFRCCSTSLSLFSRSSMSTFLCCSCSCMSTFLCCSISFSRCSRSCMSTLTSSVASMAPDSVTVGSISS